jgi:L-asparaginase II
VDVEPRRVRQSVAAPLDERVDRSDKKEEREVNQISAVYRVEVRRGRGGELEADHLVTVIASDGELEGRRKPPPNPERAPSDWVTCFRSGCKPFQALPLVERGHADRFGFGDRELAVMCASHNGAPVHIEVVRSILDRIGLGEEHLLCGFHFPYDEAASDQVRCDGSDLSPVYNNCSGKHAGMLALAVAEGWPVEDYVRFDHPVQRACLAAVAEVCEADPDGLSLVVDGCSCANPAVPLSTMARAYSRLARARREDPSARQKALARLAHAMVSHPVLVAGEGRLCTDLMRAAGGEIVSKTGAEGLQCVAVRSAGVGIVAKVQDGANRAKGPPIIDFLAKNGWLSPDALAKLDEWRRPVMKNHRGIEVGTVELEIEKILPGHLEE